MSTPTPFKPALLVVDLQEDFCPPAGALPVPSGRDVIAPINTLLALPFALKIATKDWHPSTHISFASNHPSSPEPFVSSTLITHPTSAGHSYTSTLWPVHCVQQSPGAEFAAGFDVDKVDTTVHKGMDERVEMYSAFCDPFQWVEGCDAVAVSELSAVLKEKGVTDVFVGGLAMDYCVLATAKDAVRFGFRTWVVREGTRAVGGEEGEERAVKEMESAGVSVVGMDGVEVGWVRKVGGARCG